MTLVDLLIIFTNHMVITVSLCFYFNHFLLFVHYLMFYFCLGFFVAVNSLSVFPSEGFFLLRKTKIFQAIFSFKTLLTQSRITATLLFFCLIHAVNVMQQRTTKSRRRRRRKRSQYFHREQI